MQKKAIIIGAGPAGLTVAYELLKRTDVVPIILEKSEHIGGISRTIDYKGNKMDMGPHRFFSKSDRVMNWWLDIMPLTNVPGESFSINYQNKVRNLTAEQIAGPKDRPKSSMDGMLVIQRLTRIYFLRKFFAYPIQLSVETLKSLGIVRTVKILLSFLQVKVFPRERVKNLEDFIVNQFGWELYQLFFKDYTEKVWGVPCQEIPAEWGAQRIKGLSLGKAIGEAVKNLRKSKGKSSDISQKGTETSLIEQFLYPKYGPGSLWKEVARQIGDMGGKIYLNQEVKEIYTLGDEVCSVHAIDTSTGELRLIEGEYFFSTMPVQELINGLGEKVPENVREVAAGLQYRDFINVGVLLRQLSVLDEGSGEYRRLDLKDNWIYIQERDVKVGRLMIYNNWGGGMVQDPRTIWVGMEYFCNKVDDFWAMSDETIKGVAISELEKMQLARVEDVLDTTVERMEKTYPAYFGSYNRFEEIRSWIDRYSNLFLIGRNGMHKYNNADHSMLTGMVAVDNIVAGIKSKDNIWAINTEQEYHEVKREERTAEGCPARERATARISNRAGQARRTRISFLRWQSGLANFIWSIKANRMYLFAGLVIYFTSFILFKLKYPYANYMPDSYSYLEAAYSNADVNIWPVAYSKFLRLISVFTHSDKVVAAFQYFFLQCSALVFLFSLLYFLKPGKPVRSVLLIFFLFNPLPLYVANYISADALFIGFSLLWLSALLWIVFEPSPYFIIVQGGLLLICFVLRYNAIYYPLIAALAFILSKQGWWLKAGGIGMGTFLVLCSIWYTTQQMKDITGKKQFSAFGGWQLANNALYMYEHIPPSEREPVPARFTKLETMVREHMDTLNKVKMTALDSANTYFYLWSARGPLIQYMLRKWKKDSVTSYFKRWATEGPLYTAYGAYLIKKYPIEFAKHFLVPNTIKFAVPPVEFLGVYNMGADSVDRIAKDWFNYKSRKVKDNNHKEGPLKATIWYPIFATLVNVLLLIHLIGLVVLGGIKKDPIIRKLALLTVGIWVLNSVFSVFASPVVLRYQVFPVLLSFCVALVLGEAIYKFESKMNTTTR